VFDQRNPGNVNIQKSLRSDRKLVTV